jgi:hypothetical protein
MEDHTHEPTHPSEPRPEKMIQDLFQWFGKMTNDYATKWNENASKNLDLLGKDFKKFYENFENILVQGQDTLKMNATEIRKRTTDELYQTIKMNIIYHRDKCKCLHETSCVSIPILEEVKKRLLEEGFDVNYVIKDKNTNITIEW